MSLEVKHKAEKREAGRGGWHPLLGFEQDEGTDDGNLNRRPGASFGGLA